MLAVTAGGLFALGLHGTAAADRAEGLLFDTQVRLLRALRGDVRLSCADVVIVGIDAATLDRAGVPLAMLHRQLAAAVDSIARARPRALAVDLALPDRPVDAWIPGADEALTRALQEAGRRTELVFVIESDADGSLRVPFTPFAAALGENALVTALLPVDSDGVVRRFDPSLSAPGIRTMAGEIAARLGVPERAARAGWIDYTRGAPFEFVSLIDLAAHGARQGSEPMRREFEGRVVLIGSVLPYVDTVAQPVSLVAWTYPRTAPPAVLVHAQLLRSLLGHGLIRPVPAAWLLVMAVLLALVAAAAGTATRWTALAFAVPALLALATWLLDLGWRLETFVPLAAGTAAAGVRTTIEAWEERGQRMRLARSFRGYVSPQVLRAMIDGRLDTTRARRHMAFVFADLRGFTAWSEAEPAEKVFETMNRYLATVTPLIHAAGGCVDNFRGDGIMIVFGAPEPHASPCRSAFEVACRIVLEARVLFGGDAALRRHGLDVAVGIAYGEAVYGDLGSPERRDFTAIGDAVNIAARLQDLSKALDYPVLMTMEAFERLGPVADEQRRPIELGRANLRGHSPVRIAGWRPPG